MPVIYDPGKAENKCAAGNHDLPAASRFAFGTIYECDVSGCHVRFKRTSEQKDGAYWEKYNAPDKLVHLGPYR